MKPGMNMARIDQERFSLPQLTRPLATRGRTQAIARLSRRHGKTHTLALGRTNLQLNLITPLNGRN